MDRLELATNRAEEAARVLNSPLFERAFQDTRQALLNTWAALDTVDEQYPQFANDLHRKIKCLDSVEKALRHHIETGKLAAKEIDGRTRMGKWLGKA